METDIWGSPPTHGSGSRNRAMIASSRSRGGYRSVIRMAARGTANRGIACLGEGPSRDEHHVPALREFEICEGRTKIGCPTRVSRRGPKYSLSRSLKRGQCARQVEQWRNLQGLIAEAAALRDRADSACRETQTLRRTYRRAIQQSLRLLRCHGSTSRPARPLSDRNPHYSSN